MTPYDLRLARERLGKTKAGMARELGMGGRTYRRMEQAGQKVSGPVAKAVELMLERLEAQASGVDVSFSVREEGTF